MSTSSNLMLIAAKSEFMSRRDRALAQLELYINNSVGIGEHPNIISEITKLTEELSSADDCLDTLNKYFDISGELLIPDDIE